MATLKQLWSKVRDSRFIDAYIESMLFSSTDVNDEPLDKRHGIDSFTKAELVKIIDDCERFQLENAEWLTVENYIGSSAYEHEGIAGHDFWLTRCGHGAGFWDGDWEEVAGQKLTESSKKFGNLDPYLSHGRIYLF